MNCRGMALVTGLLLMAVVALLAVTAAGSMTLQQHQAANQADRERAAANADLAESHARAWLFSRADAERQQNCVSPCFLPPGILGTLPGRPEFRSLAWWQTNGTPSGRHPQSGEAVGYAGGSSGESLWLMQEVHYEKHDESPVVAGAAWYRILSRGSGRQPGSVVVTETIVARPWGGDWTPAAYPPVARLRAFCDQFAEKIDCGTVAWRRLR